ncbi:MAG: hypothetical protein ACJ78Q_07470 [Chloroflexia bacterium]
MSRGRLALVWHAAVVALVTLITWGPVQSWAAPAAQAQTEPEISARAAIVVEYPSGRILFSRSMHDRLAPASTTKLMTAILALEHGNLEETVTVSPDDLVGESTMGLEAGEQQTVHNLLYGMLLPSGNDAAMAVARHLGSLEAASTPDGKDPVHHFAEMMNARAGQLGLTDSHFANPHGLDTEGHVSSAYDLASLAWYALHFPVFNEIVKTPSYNAPGGHPLRNTNEMLTRYGGSDGIKTGWTDAGGLCLVTSATHDGHRLISVVLNAPRWYKDSAAILDYGFARLAAASNDSTAEVLSVVGRGAASWVLASASPAPTSQAPAAIPPVALAQGGGAPPKVKSESPPVAAITENHSPANAQTGEIAARYVSSAQTPVLPVPLWPAALAGLLLLAVTPVLLRRNRLRTAGPHLSVGTRWPLDLPAAWLGSRQTAQPSRQSQTEPSPAPAALYARTLGAAPVPRRREPNLLLSPEEAARQHVLRAVGLAAEGRQGSSMSEFLLALRLGLELDAEQLHSAIALVPAAFLALARAQQAAGQPEAARQTLRYGVSTFPNDRVLQLSLYQLSSK